MSVINTLDKEYIKIIYDNCKRIINLENQLLNSPCKNKINKEITR